MTKTTKETKKALYTFNWIGGGFNQVWADTEAEAIEAIKTEFTCCGLKPDLKSLKRLEDRKAQNAHWDSFPSMN